MSVLEFDWWIGDDDEKVTVVVDSYNPGAPAQIWGPPERCYEAEPAECEFTVLRKDGTEYTPTKKESEAIYSECLVRCDELEEEYDE